MLHGIIRVKYNFIHHNGLKDFNDGLNTYSIGFKMMELLKYTEELVISKFSVREAFDINPIMVQ